MTEKYLLKKITQTSLQLQAAIEILDHLYDKVAQEGSETPKN